jgi:hypothetical protein
MAGQLNNSTKKFMSSSKNINLAIVFIDYKYLLRSFSIKVYQTIFAKYKKKQSLD